MSKRKSKRQKSADSYTKAIEEIIAKYVAATGDHLWTKYKVAEWAIQNGLHDAPVTSPIKKLADTIGRCARQVSIVDEKGRTVRKYLAFQYEDGQPTLWVDKDEIVPEQMDKSKTLRRNKLASGAIQLQNDLDHFNENRNPGDPLTFDPDFSQDIEMSRQSDEYEDVPPEDDDDDMPPPKG